MDYEGNYFPDEEEEISKPKKVTKKVLRYSLLALVAAVYIVVFAVILNNCEPDMYESFVFSPEANKLYAESPTDFEVYELFPTTFMSYDGSVQISGVGYASTAYELEIGIKYNKRLEGDGLPRFVLTDTDGNVYDFVTTAADSQGRYNYVRLCFKNVALPLDENVYIDPELSAAVEGEGEMYETFSYTLQIYTTDDENDTPEAILIFNNVTPIKQIVYKQ